jgi:hypothetical protein
MILPTTNDNYYNTIRLLRSYNIHVKRAEDHGEEQ